jgi:hypothetical protein
VVRLSLSWVDAHEQQNGLLTLLAEHGEFYEIVDDSEEMLAQGMENLGC